MGMFEDQREMFQENKDISIRSLLSSINDLNELNGDCLSREESEEHGWMILYTSELLIRSFIKTYYPRHFESKYGIIKTDKIDKKKMN